MHDFCSNWKKRSFEVSSITKDEVKALRDEVKNFGTGVWRGGHADSNAKKNTKFYSFRPLIGYRFEDFLKFFKNLFFFFLEIKMGKIHR